MFSHSWRQFVVRFTSPPIPNSVQRHIFARMCYFHVRPARIASSLLRHSGSALIFSQTTSKPHEHMHKDNDKSLYSPRMFVRTSQIVRADIKAYTFDEPRVIIRTSILHFCRIHTYVFLGANVHMLRSTTRISERWHDARQNCRTNVRIQSGWPSK